MFNLTLCILLHTRRGYRIIIFTWGVGLTAHLLSQFAPPAFHNSDGSELFVFGILFFGDCFVEEAHKKDLCVRS